MPWQPRITDTMNYTQTIEQAKTGEFRLQCLTTGDVRETRLLSIQQCLGNNRALDQGGSTYRWESTSKFFKSYI